jgi:hypothetical protein
MGIVLDRRHILTCAHVLNAAAKVPLETQTRPQAAFAVDFPFCPHASTIEGEPVIWNPMGDSEESDIALMKSERDIPPEVGVAQLLERCDLAKGAPLAVFGAPAGVPQGQIALGSYTGRVEKRRHQFDGGSVAHFFVKRGYSGAAVWNDHRFVVGMTTSRYNGPELSALMIPVDVIHEITAPIVDTNVRRRDPERSSVLLLGKGRERKRTVTLDAISIFSRHVARTVEQRLPEARIRQSKHSWKFDGERFFYIADAANEVNTLASAKIEDDGYPLSYELLFHEPRLDAATNFDVGLIWDCESDSYLFGIYGAEARMEHYVDELRAAFPRSFAVDYLRVDAVGSLEIGYHRQIVRNARDALIKDRPLKNGSASAAEDIIGLQEHALPLLLRSLFKRP